MKITLLVVLVLLVAHFVLQRLARIPAKYRDLDTPRVRSMLESLYVRGLDGAALHVATLGGGDLVRVHKYIEGGSEVGLKVHVPAAALAVRGGPDRDEVLRQLACVAAPPQRHGSSDDLVVDCGSSMARAVVVVESALRQVMRLNPERDCVAWIEGAHPNPRAHPGFAVAPEA